MGGRMRIGACQGICGPGPRPVAGGDGTAPPRDGGGRSHGDPPPRHPRSLHVRSPLDGFVEAVRLAPSGRAVAAARAFAAGNGYLPGQVVDRIV